MSNELEKELEKKFFCSAKFVQEIEHLVQHNTDMKYIDAIIHFCEQNSVELEISSTLRKNLKHTKLRY